MVTGVLLTNIGSPRSHALHDVWKYLIEFLLDKRVIDKPYFLRQLLVRGLIVPSRVFASSRSYKKIWLQEGSPLVVYSQRLADSLQQTLGSDYKVVLGMRYQKPSISEALLSLKKQRTTKLIILPLFPQYASATTGSSCEKVLKELISWETLPEIASINNFATFKPFIDAITTKAKAYSLEEYDTFLFSFHGLPESAITKEKGCELNEQCCANISSCYRSQCMQTANSLIKALNLKPESCLTSFQSRLGKTPWLKPYTQEVLIRLAKERRSILVFTPSFVTDCLETIYEIGYEYAQEFYLHGGKKLDRIESLNYDPEWVLALKNLVLERT